MSKFKKGQTVTWTSKGWRKTGEVVAVVKAGADLPASILSVRKYDLSRVRDRGKPRTEQSYVIAVTRGENAKPTLYWPHVSALTPELSIAPQTATA